MVSYISIVQFIHQLNQNMDNHIYCTNTTMTDPMYQRDGKFAVEYATYDYVHEQCSNFVKNIDHKYNFIFTNKKYYVFFVYILFCLFTV